MKVEIANRDIQRSSSFEEKSMGLAKGSEAFVFNVLRKDLYSDPIGSLIREYTVNAQDEHRKFGKSDIPIAIQVPNQFSPELHIRDFAGGLTEEQVFEFFGNYGASDKRDSNLAVGFFGLGCKSAFAYTDSYIVKSFKDGMEYTFNIYIDETEIGKVAKLSAEPTTEPNGIEIIVPVKSHDINEFQKKVVSTVRYFKTKPTITGMSETPNLEPKTAAIKGDGWEFFGNGSPTVIMGEIAYPLDYYSIPDQTDWEYQLLRSEMNIYVNIGDVQVTASREALQMSPKTIDAIRTKLKDIKDVMVSETLKTFNNVKNLMEAKYLYGTVVMGSGGYSRIVRDSGIKVTWDGEEITDNVIKLDKMFHSVTRYFKHRDTIKSSTQYDIICNREYKFYFDDTDGKFVNYKRRAKTLLNAGEREVYVIHTTDKADLEKFLGLSVKTFESYNAVTPTILTSSGVGVDPTKKAKHASKVFVLNHDALKYARYGAASEAWDVKEVEDLEGVYVPIERFKPNMGRIYDLDSLSRVLTALEQVGIDTEFPIYGIKNGGSTDGLTRLDAWIDATIAKETELLKNYAVVKGFSEGGFPDLSYLKVSALPDGCVAKKYATALKEASSLYRSNNQKYSRVFNYTKVNVEADKTLSELSKEFTATYPLLAYVSSYHLDKPEVVEYILERESGVENSAPTPLTNE